MFDAIKRNKKKKEREVIKIKTKERKKNYSKYLYDTFAICSINHRRNKQIFLNDSSKYKIINLYI